MEENLQLSQVTIFLREKLEEVLPYPLLTIYQALGLNESEAQTAYSKTLVIRCNHAFINSVFLVHQANWPTEEFSLIDQLSAVLESYKVTILQLGDLLIVNILPSDTPIVTQQDAAYLYKVLGPHFPGQIGSDYIQISLPDETHKRLRTWSPEVMQMINHCFGEYLRWFTNKKEEISPQFDEIKEEIGDYLKNSYAINPKLNGFVKWFLSNKLGSTTVEFELQSIPSLSEDDYMIVGLKADLSNNELQPHVIEKDLHEYCFWKLQQQDNIYASNQQANISNGFSITSLTHQPTSNRPEKASNKKVQPETFAEVFNKQSEIQDCIDALTKIENPVISDKGEWIGKKRGSKGSISILVAWIEVLEIRGKLIKGIDRLHLIKLLNVYFIGLNMGTKAPGMFDKKNPIQDKYITIFLTLIKK